MRTEGRHRCCLPALETTTRHCGFRFLSRQNQKLFFLHEGETETLLRNFSSYLDFFFVLITTPQKKWAVINSISRKSIKRAYFLIKPSKSRVLLNVVPLQSFVDSMRRIFGKTINVLEIDASCLISSLWLLLRGNGILHF